MKRLLACLLLLVGLSIAFGNPVQAQRGRFRGRGYYGRPGPRYYAPRPRYYAPQRYYAPPRYYHNAPYRPYGGHYYYRPRPYYRAPGPAIIIRP
jgi:hypothetical protein